MKGRFRRTAVGAGLLVAVAVSVVGVRHLTSSDRSAGASRPSSTSVLSSPGTDQQPSPIPAMILSPDTPVPVSPVLIRVTNGWVVCDAKTLVAVYAGRAGGGQERGRFVVIRQDWVRGEQTRDVV